MLVLGVDPGYERLGVALIKKSNSQEELIFSDCLISPSSLPFSERLLLIGTKFEEIIKKYKPEAVAVEKIFFTANQKTAIKVAETRGVIEYITARHQIQVVEYTPLQIKSCVTGYGKASKDQIIGFLKNLIKIEKEIKYDDEFDAIAVALTHLAYYKFSELSH